jgi:hypothetical protein
MFIDVNDPAVVAVVALPLNAPVNVVALTVLNVGVLVVNNAWLRYVPKPVVDDNVICEEPETTPSVFNLVLIPVE